MKRLIIREIEALVGSHVVFMSDINAGLNSKIFKVTTEDKKTYCIKQYVKRPGDKRDRLSTEFTALTFLWSQGFRDIPQPIARDTRKNLGTYSYIQGKTLRNSAITRGQLLQALSFLSRLHALSMSSSLPKIPLASEACFSINEYILNINKRVRALHKISNPKLNEFLHNQWEPAWKNLLKRYIRNKTLLPKKYRTLSPSDFGFHNAIADPKGKLTFVDFEYFGWDDPAKLISDFLLHPGMKLTKKQKKFFVQEAIKIYKNDSTLAKRFPGVYVLLGFKWSLIMLNSFLHNDKKKIEQLEKAKRNLSKIVYEYKT